MRLPWRCYQIAFTEVRLKPDTTYDTYDTYDAYVVSAFRRTVDGKPALALHVFRRLTDTLWLTLNSTIAA